MTPAEHALRELGKHLRLLPQLDVRGRRRDRPGLRDDDRLLVVGLEAGSEQPVAQLRAVVRVVLPLDPAGNLAHAGDERLDAQVGRRPEDGAPAVADE